MDELDKLEHLSLVSKICTELENHLELNDKDLAEFIIHLAEKNPKLEDFKSELIKNGAEFSDSFISNLLRIIVLMKPAIGSKTNQQALLSDEPGKDSLAKKFPGLAIPNKFAENPEEDQQNADSIVDSMMAELEALAPATSSLIVAEEKKKVKHRSRSREKKKRSRSRSKDKKKKRSRSRSRDKKRRSRSRSRDRKKRSRSRSRDRKKRSRSRDKRRRSREASREKRRRSRSFSPKDRKRDQREDRKRLEMKDDPEPGKIYDGKIANIVSFGCFVQIFGVRKKWEGLVHISQLRAEGRVADVNDVVSRGDNVKVKVVSITGQKVSLSMKEVDQLSGSDLNPLSHKPQEEEMSARNPNRPVGVMSSF